MERKKDIRFNVLAESDLTPDWSPDLEVVFLLQGGGLLQLEGSETHHVVGEGAVFAVNPFQTRSLILRPDGAALSLRLSPSFLAALLPETEIPWLECKSFLFSETEQTPFDRIRSDLAAVFRARYKEEAVSGLHLRSRAGVLLDDLVRNFAAPGTIRPGDSGRAHLKKAVDYIHRNYRNNISLSELAAHTYLSSSYLSRSFRKYLGVTFTEYLAQVRLLHALSLLQGEATITEIAYETGFPNTSTLIETFKHYKGMTPGQYRRDAAEYTRKKQHYVEPDEEGMSVMFRTLMDYAEQPDQMADPIPVPAAAREIRADAASGGRKLSHTWRRLVNAGYAKDLLGVRMQRQVRDLQQSIGFEYIRCKGILDDDMVVCVRDSLGEMVMSFVNVDEVVDFILSAGAKPYLEFSHMPYLIAKNKEHFLGRPALISAPADMELWKRLLTRLLEHLKQRYGTERMKEWLFAPWTTPDYSDVGLFTAEEYVETYTIACRAIREACKELRVCGFGSSVHLPENMLWLLERCGSDCVPDLLTFHSFAAVAPGEEQDALKLVTVSGAFNVAVSGEENYLTRGLRDIREAAGKEGIEQLPVILDEWSNNIWQRDLCNDTCYKSAYLFKSILENYDRFYAMGYFNIGDHLDEIAPAPEQFHGGFGLFTRGGIRKSAFGAMQLLSHAGDRLIAKGDGWFITASEKEVQIFLYHYCHYDLLYRYRHTTHLTKTDRYRVFQEKPPQVFHIRLSGMEPGEHTVRRYGIGPDGGSAYDAWIRMGAPEPMSEEEMEMVSRLSAPSYRTERVESGSEFELKARLIPHEVQLITVTR